MKMNLFLLFLAFLVYTRPHGLADVNGVDFEQMSW